MSEKYQPTPRPHEKTSIVTGANVAKRSRTYNGWSFNRPPTPLTADQQRHIGQQALFGSTAEVEFEDPRSEATKQMDIEAERPGNPWNWSR